MAPASLQPTRTAPWGDGDDGGGEDGEEGPAGLHASAVLVYLLLSPTAAATPTLLHLTPFAPSTEHAGWGRASTRRLLGMRAAALAVTSESVIKCSRSSLIFQFYSDIRTYE